MLSELTHLERADLLRRVQLLHASEFMISQRVLTVRRWFIRFLAACCLALIPWTIGLAVSLPRTYVTANWRVLWTGFDVVLLGCLAVTAWGLWRQRQIVVPASIITSVLLLISIRALRVGARAARALEQDAPVSSLWRTSLITFPGPPKIQ